MIIGSLLAFYLTAHPGGWEQIVTFASGIIVHPHSLGLERRGFPIPCSSASSVDSVPALPPTALMGDRPAPAVHRNLRGTQTAVIGSGIVVSQFTFYLTIGVMLFTFYQAPFQRVQKADELFTFLFPIISFGCSSSLLLPFSPPLSPACFGIKFPVIHIREYFFLVLTKKLPIKPWFAIPASLLSSGPVS